MYSNNVSFGSYRTDPVELKGGINENVSSLELYGGELIDCKNYMMAEGGYGGYKSIPGYEVIDGIYTPSTYESLVLTVGQGTQQILQGEEIAGATSGATVVALADGVLQSGSYVGGDAIQIVECLYQSGDLLSLETLEVLAVSVGVAQVLDNLVGATVDYHEAVDLVRSMVLEVPGEGKLLGAHVFLNKAYAFRKRVGLDEVALFVEDESVGWLEVDTSLAPMIYEEGNHDFKFTNYNFYGTDNTGLTFSMYWVDGVNSTKYYNGSIVQTIVNTSIIGDDKPIDIIAHNYSLWLAYPDGILQYSRVGYPDIFDGVQGAGEIGLGATITALEVGVQSTLIIFLKEGIRVLSGNVDTGYVLEVFSHTSGAYEWTPQRLLGTIYFTDDRGVTTLEALDDFGDYTANSISQKFKDTLQDTRKSLTVSCTSRDLNQYRLFFDDNSSIYISFQGKEQAGATFCEYPLTVDVLGQGEDTQKRDYIIFGDGETGFVYRMDSGTSFNGMPIITRMGTAYYHYGSPRTWKAFKRATLEVAGEKGQTFWAKVDFDYNADDVPRTIWYYPEVYSLVGSATYGSSRWGEMVYGGAAVANRVPIYLQGIGTNMSYKIISNETYRQPHIVQNIITDYKLTNRRV